MPRSGSRVRVPFPALKKKTTYQGGFLFYVVIWTRTREEGPTKFFRGRSPWKEFRTLSASEKPVRVASQPCASKDSGAAISPFSPHSLFPFFPPPFQKNHYFPPSPLQRESLFLYMGHLAGIAQLVEHDLAKVGVEGPSPFSRSKTKEDALTASFFVF